MKKVVLFLLGVIMTLAIGGVFGALVIGVLSFDIELSFNAKLIIMVVSLLLASRVSADTLREES